MPVSARALFDWHERPGAFERLQPGWQPGRVVSRTGGITPGSRVDVEVPLLGGLVHQRLLVEHRDYQDGQEFTDVQLKGPFARWEHRHLMQAAADGTSILDDRIDYELPLGPIGDLAAGWFVRGELDRLFAFRHARTKADLVMHARFADQPRRTVAITGGSGLIGQALTGLLRTGGHTVRWITRSPDHDRRDIGWNPAAGDLDPAALEGVDSVIHLAGANVGERWTSSHKAAIRSSRVLGTRTLVAAMRLMKTPPKVLISGSAIGYYGDGGATMIDEESPVGSGFLADVCAEWEREAVAAESIGMRVALARTGVVLSAAGGALAKMLPPFRVGVGGPMGSGDQYLSWISLEDEVAALHWLLMHGESRGAYNLTGPAPATNADFARALGHVLRRPALLPLPSFALTALFGEMAQSTILDGQRVLPVRLEREGFTFQHASLESALRFELGR